MNEPQFGNKVRRILNEGTRLDEKTLGRLQAARELALKRQRIEQPATGFAWAGGVLGSFGGITGFSVRLLLPLAVLVGGLLAINGWQQNQRVAEVEEIDALLLTDDLPLDAYLDKGFEAWLKKRSPL
ncbi:MAG: DUF3619 family protein [Proteobacteria bacterium]|nr:DUF3619 family protein [Pseudomonadota bacterium]